MLLTELDGIGNRAGVYVVAATNRPDMIDSAILRPGRLGTHIFVDVPHADGRVDILRTLYRTLLPKSTPEELDALEAVARDTRCNGFTGADLSNLHLAAAQVAVERMAVETSVKGVAATVNRIILPDWEEALRKTNASVSTESLKAFRRLKEKSWS